MNTRGLLSILGIILLVAFGSSIAPGCANVVPPQGGPRDSLPPVLLKATPGDSTRNFNGNRIVFSFDEFVELQNVQENLIVSPSPKVNPTVEYRLNTVTVKLRDTLEPNTTYSLNFGNAIKDFTEGNPLKSFTYTFSTGRYIDSLELSGSVILAETGKIDTTLIVLLHTSPDDSAVVKERARYITRLDSRGRFIFKNLPPKTFYIYALKDDGGTRRYLSSTQLFAFADQPVVVDGKTAPVTLYAYAVAPAPVTALPTRTAAPERRVGRTGGTSPTDRLRFTTSAASNVQDLLEPFTISFDTPLKHFDSTKLKLYTDTTFVPDTAYAFVKDSTGKKLILKNTWKENTLYQLILDKDFAEDTAGRKLLKTDTVSFRTKKFADYGKLNISFSNLDLAKHPVLQFISGERVFRSVALTATTYSQLNFPPGEFELRILYDTNQDGEWTPGEFFKKHRQPELVKPIDRKIVVKAAWENQFSISL